MGTPTFKDIFEANRIKIRLGVFFYMKIYIWPKKIIFLFSFLSFIFLLFVLSSPFLNVITTIENGFNVNVNMLTYGFNIYLVGDLLGDLKDEHLYPILYISTFPC